MIVIILIFWSNIFSFSLYVWNHFFLQQKNSCYNLYCHFRTQKWIQSFQSILMYFCINYVKKIPHDWLINCLSLAAEPEMLWFKKHSSTRASILKLLLTSSLSSLSSPSSSWLLMASLSTVFIAVNEFSRRFNSGSICCVVW